MNLIMNHFLILIFVIFVPPILCFNCGPGRIVGTCGCCKRDGHTNEICYTGGGNSMTQDLGYGVCVPQAHLNFFTSFDSCEQWINDRRQYYCLIRAQDRDYVYPMYGGCASECISSIEYDLATDHYLGKPKGQFFFF